MQRLSNNPILTCPARQRHSHVLRLPPAIRAPLRRRPRQRRPHLHERHLHSRIVARKSTPQQFPQPHIHILNHFTEHSDRHRRRLPPRLRRRPRRCPPLLQLGFQSPQRPAPQRRHRSLGRLSTHQLHAPTLRRRLHISRLRRRCP